MLTRKDQERIHIGNDVVVTVVKINANQVRLGITAPPGTIIVREELLSQAKEDEYE